MADPCTVIKLSVTNLDQQVKDPALAALMAEGWGVVASVIVAPAGGGEPMLHVVLSPPKPPANLGGGQAAWALPIAGLQVVILIAILAVLWV